MRPGVTPRVSLALKVYGDETHELTGAENYGNLELRLRLLEEAQSEISNLHYLHDRFPDCAICFPLFHGTDGPCSSLPWPHIVHAHAYLSASPQPWRGWGRSATV